MEDLVSVTSLHAYHTEGTAERPIWPLISKIPNDDSLRLIFYRFVLCFFVPILLFMSKLHLSFALPAVSKDPEMRKAVAETAKLLLEVVVGHLYQTAIVSCQHGGAS